MPLTNATGIKDVTEYLQGILQDRLAKQITTLGFTNITAPLDADIQIGPEFAFSADPVIGIDWVSSFLFGQIGPREERTIRCKFHYFFNVSQSTGVAAEVIEEAERALWFTLHKYYRNGSPTIIYLEPVESRPILREPSTGIEGYGVEMLIDAKVWFVLPPPA